MSEFSEENKKTWREQDHDLLLNINAKISNFYNIFDSKVEIFNSKIEVFNAKMEAVVDNLEKHIREDQGKLIDHESRIRFLEGSLSKFVGGIMLLQVIIGIVTVILK